MSGVYAIRRAAKPCRCTECGQSIDAGNRYLYAACPPWHEMNRSGKVWWIIKACLHCTERHGLHNSDTRAQMDALIQIPRRDL